MNIFEKIADQHSGERKSLVDNPAYVSLAICGEAGELANLIKKQWAGYQKVDNGAIKKELADVVNYCLHMTLALGMTFEELDNICVEKHHAFMKKLAASQQSAQE